MKLLIVNSKTSMRFKSFLKKKRVRFEDRWFSDQHMIKATHDYGTGTELSKWFNVTQCPEFIFFPRESKFKKNGPKAYAKWDKEVRSLLQQLLFVAEARGS